MAWALDGLVVFFFVASAFGADKAFLAFDIFGIVACFAVADDNGAGAVEADCRFFAQCGFIAKLTQVYVQAASSVGKAFGKRSLIGAVIVGFAFACIIDIFLCHAGVFVACHVIGADGGLVVGRAGIAAFQVLDIDAFAIDADAVFAAALVIRAFLGLFAGFSVLGTFSVFAYERGFA